MNTKQALTLAPTGIDVPAEQNKGGFSLVPQNLTQALELSKFMAQMTHLPEYLHNNPGNCLYMVLRAGRIEMDPIAYAEQSYETVDKSGKKRISYMAQLIHAIVISRAGLKNRLEVSYEGEGGDGVGEMSCRVVGTFQNGDTRVYISPKIKDIKVKNSPLWTADARQQLHYYSTRAWARAWCPEVIMGFYTRDEIQSGDATDADALPGDRLTLIESDVLGEDPIIDPNAPLPTAPLLHRMSFRMEQVAIGDESTLTGIRMALQPEIDAVPEADRDKLRDLYALHLKRVRGQIDHEAAMTESRRYREPQDA